MSDTGFVAGGFEEKPSIDQVFMQQLRIINMADGENFDEAVYKLLNLLPSRWRDWVLSQEDRYLQRGEEFVYKEFCGIKMGTPEEPVLADPSKGIPMTEDGEIDYSDSNVVSPKLVTTTSIDTQELHSLIMQAAELAGLTWNLRREPVVAGMDSYRPPAIEVIR